MQTMKKLFLILSVAAGLVSCEDFLTAGDPNKIDAPSYFRNESDLEAYANGFLQTMIPTAISVATGDARADYMAWRGEWQYLTDNFDADDQSGWSTGSWEDLRNINYFLGNFRRAAAGEAILDHYEGVARFWRAYFYMNKVKTFGAVPWYDREIDANDREALYKPRDSREYVMRKVLEDLDFASTHCITNAKLEVNSVRITRNVALAFKARCCLYEGTFRKYHANDPSTGKPWTADESEMYLRACADACETLMGEGKYALVSDPAKVATQYRSLFTSESVASGEVIWARAYDASLNATHILNTYFVNMQYGSYSLTRQFVNTYLNRDGSRFTDKAGYEKTLFADEFENRDYRLMQSIRYPGYTRRNNNVNTPYAPDFGYCVTGYQPIKWVIDDTSMDSNTAPCATSIPILRYAEVLLNYAEAKAELGEFSETVWNATIKLLRERAGVDGAMPSAYDPYMAEYFLNTTTDMAILEIRRERDIELLLENCRWDDDMRWGMGRLLERPWYGVYVGELGKVYDMDGDGSGDVCFVRENPPVTEPGVTYRVLGGDYALTDGDSGYIECYIRMNRKWDDKKYVRPIPTTALNDNPALGQNPGWTK